MQGLGFAYASVTWQHLDGERRSVAEQSVAPARRHRIRLCQASSQGEIVSEAIPCCIQQNPRDRVADSALQESCFSLTWSEGRGAQTETGGAHAD